MSASTSSNRKGQDFENEIHTVMMSLERQHPDHVRVVRQPKLGLYDGQEVIPDFDLRLHLHFARQNFLIECQNRRRSSTAIAQKIRSIKSLSTRNIFVFVYAASVPKATRKVLEADGVTTMSFTEFAAFVCEMDTVLTDIKRSLRRDDYEPPTMELMTIW